ncbi:MAG TPA: energy transducer TonB [Candidatus Acidoferrum sp.]|nr:energy transducer TonB [Candidatus Acidoferrum sp.]
MSDLGSLSSCMIDNDQEAIARARRLRRKALLASVCLEAACLVAMLLWPLVTPGVLPRGYVVTPLPPYHGGGNTGTAQPHRPMHGSPHPIPVPNTNQIFFPGHHGQKPTVVDEPPSLDADVPPGLPDGQGPLGFGGPLIIGGGDRPTVAPPRAPEPVRPTRQKISEGIMEGQLIHRVDPEYPVIARAMRLSGAVQLRAIIGTDGSVKNLEVLSGSTILARAAERAVWQWRYRPTLLSGTPVEVETYITVNFVLSQ